MPHVMGEEEKENPPPSLFFSILTWWRQFHFSGRVIACSVLLGLGLILIGGLIFAINITDDSKLNNVDGATGPVTAKAPSNYTGPVVMGIGGFIVITGVIMCLFETQVCRKKTGDSSPLISDKADDPERNGSDPVPEPSTSHGHRSHKHGTHKTSTSPKKTKGRHVKSRSKERNLQKNTSPKSPPLPIEPSKSFITSSEDNFLTPPNTLEENVAAVQKGDSVNSEEKNSGLMKSFTSSDPSWNQSTEFLTPSTSFRDTSVSLNNSVEIDENYDDKRKNSTELTKKQNISPEYMTPLTVEEDRIQQLLIRVKNEQKQMAESKEMNDVKAEYSSQEKESTLLQAQIVKKDKEDGVKIKEKDSSSNMPNPEIETTSKDVGQAPSIQIEEANSDEPSQNNYETNVSEKNLSTVHNNALGEISDDVEELTSSQENSISVTNVTSAPESDKVASNGNVQKMTEQADLDSSVSSDETVVSPDNFQENDNNGSSNGNSTLSTQKEISEEDSKCHNNVSKSSDNKPSVETDIDHHDNQEKYPQQDVDDVQDRSLNKRDDLKVEVYTDKESKDNVS